MKKYRNIELNNQYLVTALPHLFAICPFCAQELSSNLMGEIILIAHKYANLVCRFSIRFHQAQLSCLINLPNYNCDYHSLGNRVIIDSVVPNIGRRCLLDETSIDGFIPNLLDLASIENFIKLIEFYS